MTDRLPVSVIIPTHNRAAMLPQTLAALERQSFGRERFEVVIVADGCTDETVTSLRGYPTAMTLNVLEAAGQGAAAARNCGAAHAAGDLLIFLDDDIEAGPALIEAYVQIQQEQPGSVAIGYLLLASDRPPGYFRRQLDGWWQAMFDRLNDPGHRFTYKDLLSGNFSLPAELFGSVGGFNPIFGMHEDYELGARLIAAGTPFRYVPAASGFHHDRSDVRRILYRQYQDGYADVQLGLEHPELRVTLPVWHLFHGVSPYGRLAEPWARTHATWGEKLAGRLILMLDRLEAARLHRVWQQVLSALLMYWYMQGITALLPTHAALLDFLRGAPQRPDPADTLTVDLREGLAAARRRLDAERPAAVCLRYGSLTVSQISAQPGCERLRGAHLQALLAQSRAAPLLKRLADEERRQYA